MFSLLVVSVLLLVSLKCGDFNTECKYYWDSLYSDELTGIIGIAPAIIAIAPDECAFSQSYLHLYYNIDGDSGTIKDFGETSQWLKCNGNQISYQRFDGNSNCDESNADTITSAVLESDCSTSNNCNCNGNSCAISVFTQLDDTCPNYNNLVEQFETDFSEVRSLKLNSTFYLAINDEHCWNISNDTWTYSVDFDCGPPSDGSSDKHVITLDGYKSADCSGIIDDTYQFPEDPDQCINGTTTVTLDCGSANSLFLIYAFAVGIIITLIVQ